MEGFRPDQLMKHLYVPGLGRRPVVLPIGFVHRQDPVVRGLHDRWLFGRFERRRGKAGQDHGLLGKLQHQTASLVPAMALQPVRTVISVRGIWKALVLCFPTVNLLRAVWRCE